jgi:NitT/TauT family transport system ATP-binding protein
MRELARDRIMNKQVDHFDRSPAAGLAIGSASPAKVELKAVCKSYGEEWERADVIKDLTLEIAGGKLTVVVGPSGCGKSTLVNLIAGFERPNRGEILLNGKPITGPSKDRMVVFQETALIPWQTTYQNVVFGPKLRGDLRGKALRQRAHELLTKVGLQDFIHKYPLQLSGGMQRRAELARALINQPQLLIMDEPFRGLDAMSRGLMQEFFLQLFEESRRTNLFVTSEIDEAIFLADRLVVLSNRPAQLRTVIDIHLPRPRHYQVLSSPEAFEYKREAMEILHQEAMRSFRFLATERAPARP